MEVKYEGSKLILPEITCNCGMHHAKPDMDIYIGKGIIAQSVDFIAQRDFGKNVVVVTDQTLYQIAAKNVESRLQAAGYQVTLCCLERETPLIPDERALGEILLAVDNDTDFLIAVGSGSITDVTRYVAHRTQKPFVCIGTAPSMDGYTSVIAPLTLGNLKVNKPAGYPKVLICDLEIMADAPYKMLIAGFGDVLGKHIAKADWLLGNIINDEPVCPDCIALTSQAVQKCVDNIEEIKNRTEQGIQSLIEGLILAGLTILIIGNTRPVASNEHGIAHYWEMMKLLKGEEPPSHGISVGVATVYAVAFFEYFLLQDPSAFNIECAQAACISKAERTAIIKEKYGEKIGAAILRDNPSDFLDWEEQYRRFQKITTNMDRIRNELAFLPTTRQVKDMFVRLGAPYLAGDIDINDELLLNGLIYAKDYRSRYTVFKSANELGVLQDIINRVIHSIK